MKTIFALLLGASTLFAQTQPQPQPKPDVAEGQQTPPTKTVPAAPTPSTNQPVEFNTQPLRWRSIGPANMGGRIADFAGPIDRQRSGCVLNSTG